VVLEGTVTVSITSDSVDYAIITVLFLALAGGFWRIAETQSGSYRLLIRVGVGVVVLLAAWSFLAALGLPVP
jgi:hypothetical protein